MPDRTYSSVEATDTEYRCRNSQREEERVPHARTLQVKAAIPTSARASCGNHASSEITIDIFLRKPHTSQATLSLQLIQACTYRAAQWKYSSPSPGCAKHEALMKAELRKLLPVLKKL